MENEPPPKLWARRLCLHLAELKTQTVETDRHEPQWPARPPTRRCQLLLHLLQPPHRQPRVQRASHKRRLPKSHLPSLAARCPQVPALLCVSSYSQPCFAARSGIWPDAVAQPDPVSVVRGRKGFMTGSSRHVHVVQRIYRLHLAIYSLAFAVISSSAVKV